MVEDHWIDHDREEGIAPLLQMSKANSKSLADPGSAQQSGWVRLQFKV